MDQLPELVKSAISSACSSGKSLSWKVQECKKGLLIQLVWKTEPVGHSVSGKTTRVGSNWNPTKHDDNTVPGKPASKKKVSPSRACRSARRLQAFLERKQSVHVDSHVTQEELDLCNRQPVLSDAGLDEDLKVYLDKEVECVDFSIDNGQPGLTLDLNCGKTEWTPVRVKKPIISGDANDELSVAELNELDDVVFRSGEVDDMPGVVLTKGCMQVWTPIATPIATRTRLRSKLYQSNN